jgi:hypothetical protein
MANALPDEALPAINSISALPDVQSSDRSFEAILKLYNAGIFTGSDRLGTFNPDSTITRSEVATVVTRMAVSSERQSFTIPVAVFGSISVEKVYTYNRSGSHYVMLEVYNNGSTARRVVGQISFKNASGEVDSVKTAAIGCLAPGKSFLLSVTTTSDYSSFDYEISSADSTSLWTTNTKNIATSFTDKGDSFLIAAINNGSTDVSYVEFYVLYFDDAGTVVDQDWGFVSSLGATSVGAGERAYRELSYVKTHASYAVFINAYTPVTRK